MPLGELQETLLLPAVVAPTFVTPTDPTSHLWSSHFQSAEDFGPLTTPDATLQVVGPRVANRIFVFDPTTLAYGWLQAESIAPVDNLFTP